MKKTTKQIIGVSGIAIVLVATTAIIGTLTKGFQTVETVSDIAKSGTVVKTLKTTDLVDVLQIYENDDDATMLGQSEDGQAVNVTQFKTDLSAIGFENSKISNIWGVVSSLDYAAMNSIISGTMTRTVAEKDDEGAVKYFDAIRINFKAEAAYYLCGYVNNKKGEAEPMSQTQKQTLLNSFVELKLADLEDKEDETVTLDQDFGLISFGYAGDVAKLKLDSIELVNHNNKLANQYLTYAFAE